MSTLTGGSFPSVVYVPQTFSDPPRLTEPEAWREIARMYADDAEVPAGLCIALICLSSRDRISLEVQTRMSRRLIGHLGMSGGYMAGDVFFDPPRHRPNRILAALFLALEAEEEVTT